MRRGKADTIALLCIALAAVLAFRGADMSRLPPTPLVLALLLVAAGWYAATVFCLMRGLRIKVDQLPMKADWDHIENTYLRLTSGEAEEQLPVNWLK